MQNGRVIRSSTSRGDRKRFDWDGDVTLANGGWVVLRAWNDRPHPWVLDLYPYATTSPIYLDGAGRRAAPEDAAYFVAWLDRVIEAARSARRVERRRRERRARSTT